MRLRDMFGGDSHQDAADYAAAQDQRDLQSTRDDANVGCNWQVADGRYVDTSHPRGWRS